MRNATLHANRTSASMENRNVGLGVGIFPPSRDSIKSALIARTLERKTSMQKVVGYTITSVRVRLPN